MKYCQMPRLLEKDLQPYQREGTVPSPLDYE